MPFGLLHTILACNSLLPYTIATLGTNSTGLLHQCNDDEWKWHSEFWQSIDIHGIDIIFSSGCTDATCGGNTASRFSMPLTSLGEKKYYLGIFFKVQNIPKMSWRGQCKKFAGQLVQSRAVLQVPWDAPCQVSSCDGLYSIFVINPAFLYSFRSIREGCFEIKPKHLCVAWLIIF